MALTRVKDLPDDTMNATGFLYFPDFGITVEQVVPDNKSI